MEPESRVWHPPHYTKEQVRRMEMWTLDGHTNSLISTSVVDELFVMDPILFWHPPYHPMNVSCVWQ